MERAYANIAFADPACAERNLSLVVYALPASLRAPLPSLLAQVPAPDDALNFLERFLRPEAGASPRAVSYLERYPGALHYLLTVFSYSRFLSETLVQQPDLITTLHRPARPYEGGGAGRPGRSIERTRTAEDLREEFARFETTSFELPAPVVLARFKRREYLRIMLRDVLGLATLAEITLELSLLADLLLERALRIADQKLVNTYGTPQAIGPDGRRQAVELAVLSLGKLGGQELNYSSDIDLMFLYAQDGETTGGTAGAISNAEFFVRLAQSILKLVTESTPEGAVYRVDLRLRPQGSEGDLAVSLPAALDYYRNRAREWELQMLIKARGSAGEQGTARQFLHEVQPLIYRAELHLPAVEAVLNARQEMTRSLARARSRRLAAAPATEKESGWNVKLSPGGIRDIEFLTQCLQRLYGGADPWLRCASTLVALQRLHDKGHLSGQDFYRLASAYQFLRKVEHRLQLRDGLQRHTLPEAADALDRLARRAGLEAASGRAPREILLEILGQHFENVRKIYERLLSRRLAEDATPAETTVAPSRDSAGPALLRRLEGEYPRLAREVLSLGEDAKEEAGSGYARRGVYRYLNSAILAPALMGELETHPEQLRAAAELFERSDLAVDLLCRHPHEIALVSDTESATRVARASIPAATSEELEQARDTVELRVKFRRNMLVTVASALRAAQPVAPQGPGEAAKTAPLPFRTFVRITRLAEGALRPALQFAADEVFGAGTTNLEESPFAVIALGRLGTWEMDIGSDADLLLVADDSLAVEDRDAWRRTAERFVQIVSSHTRDGLLFPVDTRLRPRGGEGELLPALEALRRYFETEAAGWEAVTFLKGRPVAGNRRLGARAVQEAIRILSVRFSAAGTLAHELAHVRERVEKEGSGPRAKGRFKKVPGGFYDLEYIVGFLSLVHRVAPAAADWPARGRGNILEQIQAIEAARALGESQLAVLRSAAMLYRSVDHATRLITGRSVNQIPDPALAERIARLLRQWNVAVAGDLVATIEDTRREVRRLYEEVVLVARD